MTEERLRELLHPFLIPSVHADGLPPTLATDALYKQLLAYLELLLRWNSRTNLTAIRNPEEMMTRHFGESLFVACQLAPFVLEGATLLDVGSGAGFPGLPIQLAFPQLHVTLAESQGKKASFLMEATRTLGCRAEVWSGRVEAVPVARRFDLVTLRAVDDMKLALQLASERLKPQGVLAELSSVRAQIAPALIPAAEPMNLPMGSERILRLWKIEKAQ